MSSIILRKTNRSFFVIFTRILLIWIHLGVIQKVGSLKKREGVVIEKRTKMNRGRGVLACVYVCVFWKNTEIFKMKFYSYAPVLLLIIMALWNIKQTMMKDYNIQSCPWMARDRFRQPKQDHDSVLC